MQAAIRYGLQPTLLAVSLAIWAWIPETELALVTALFFSHVTIALLEARRPTRPEWRVETPLRVGHVVAFVVLLGVGGVVGEFYGGTLSPLLAELRATAGLDFWPHEWPALAQLAIVFFASEFVWYWMHRAEHRWPRVWRVSGHGAHHAFKKLNGLNAGLNHPLELFLLLLPSAVIEFLFGVGSAAGGAAILLGTQAAVAHANLDLNSRGIGWLLTTNRFHIHHHSVVLDESNTNYGCAVILFDRVFGTFSDAETRETGTGPTEPDMWHKFIMPFVEPEDTATAPGGSPG